MKTATSTATRLVRSCAGGVIMLLATSLTAMSTPLWEIDMSSMTTGENIQTAAYSNGVVNTKPQSVGSSAGVGSVLITENYTVGSATLSGKSVVLAKTENGSDTASPVRFTMLGSAADFTVPSDYELRFDVLLSESAFNASSTLAVRLSNANSGGSYIGSLSFSQNGKLTLTSSYADQKSTDTGVWNFGQVLSFTLQVDATNKRFNVLMNNTLIESLDLTINDNELGIRRFWIGANSDTSTFADGIGIANIETSAVPEPSRLALLLGTGALLFILNRRRNLYALRK